MIQGLRWQQRQENGIGNVLLAPSRVVEGQLFLSSWLVIVFSVVHSKKIAVSVIFPPKAPAKKPRIDDPFSRPNFALCFDQTSAHAVECKVTRKACHNLDAKSKAKANLPMLGPREDRAAEQKKQGGSACESKRVKVNKRGFQGRV